MNDYSETCRFLDLPEAGQHLYICSYLPQKPSGEAVLMAPPIGRERLRCYRELANLARHLAAGGHPVLRFDYRGEGESTGQFQQTTLTSRAQDIAAAAAELRRVSGVEELCLLGLRLGAVLALMAANEVGAGRLVLVDPLCNPKGQINTLLRSNVVLQTHYTGKVSRDSNALREGLERGEPVFVYGFPVGKPLMDELATVDPVALLDAYKGEAELLYITPKESPPKRDLKRWLEHMDPERTRTRCVVLAFNWTSRRRWMPRLDALNLAVAESLEAKP